MVRVFNVVDDELLTGATIPKGLQEKGEDSSDQSGSLTSLVTCLCLYGRNTPNGQRASCLRLSIAVGALPNGREIVTPIKSFRTVWGGSRGFRWKQAMEQFLAQFESNGNSEALKR